MDEIDSGIEFGQLEHTAPNVAVRPDRNRQFSVVACGEVDKSDLPIFVDLDVVRDMEAHARTNTHVELGGVLLGGQYVDSGGEAFVVVREALRAEHYEATRGSFKFTHETWEQITRDREQFPKDLQLVGWYHTHPDWGVFLSGMDMFICEHFFNGPLDVALVMDPCRGDRGWFFWQTENETRQKKQVSSFYLMSNRYRNSELLRFANLLSQSGSAYYDSRYDTSEGDLTVQPVVHLHDQRSPLQSVATLGMLMIQFLVLSLIAYRVLIPPADPEAEKQQSLAAEQQENSDRIFREVLSIMIDQDSKPRNLVDHFENVHIRNLELETNARSKTAYINQMEAQNSRLAGTNTDLSEKLKESKDALTDNVKKIADLKAQLDDQKQLNEENGISSWSRGLSWPLALGLAMLTAVIGVGAGYLFNRIRNDAEYETEDESLPKSSPLAAKDPPVEGSGN